MSGAARAPDRPAARDLVRELQLIDSNEGSTPPRELAQHIERLVTRPAFARHLGRRTALGAAALGMEYVDIEMTPPREMAATVRELLAADNLADEIRETHQLLTLRSTPEILELTDLSEITQLGLTTVCHCAHVKQPS